MKEWGDEGQCHWGDAGVGSHRMNRSSPAGELEKEGSMEREEHGGKHNGGKLPRMLWD